MIDPQFVTKFDRTDRELQEFFIFAVCVAGKTATTTARAVERFLNLLAYEEAEPATKDCMLRPLTMVSLFSQTEVAEEMRKAGIGCYNQKAAAVSTAAKAVRAKMLNLRTCSIAELEALPWVGPKTARFFLLHTRPNVRAAAIDTHILKHLAANGVQVPKQTPPAGRTYSRLEESFLTLADAANMTPADYDLQVWRSYATS